MCTPKNKNGRRIQRDRERIKLNQEIIKFKEDRILDFFFFFSLLISIRSPHGEYLSPVWPLPFPLLTIISRRQGR